MTHATASETGRLAAVLHDGGGASDMLLAGIAQQLQDSGAKLAGVVQTNTRQPDGCACDMELEVLGTGRVIAISLDRGRLARGCKLDSAALEEAVGLVDTILASAPDLLIINKFGKQETSGSGFHATLMAAYAMGIPVLVGLNRAHIDVWSEFSGGLGELLEPKPDAILQWCHERGVVRDLQIAE